MGFNAFSRVIQAVRITTGDHDVTVYEPGQQVFDSVQYRNHEDYDGDTNENDVALVKLPTPAILNNSTRLACLPNEDVPAGTMCTITGWGTLCNSEFCITYISKQFNLICSALLIEEVSSKTRFLIIACAHCMNNYGIVLVSSGPTSDILQEANVPIVDMDVCSDKNHYLKEGIQLNKKLMTCAGYEKGQVDTCQVSYTLSFPQTI